MVHAETRLSHRLQAKQKKPRLGLFFNFTKILQLISVHIALSHYQTLVFLV